MFPLTKEDDASQHRRPPHELLVPPFPISSEKRLVFPSSIVVSVPRFLLCSTEGQHVPSLPLDDSFFSSLLDLPFYGIQEGKASRFFF